MRQHLPTAAATFQIACGVPAVLAGWLLVVGLLDPTGRDVDAMRALLVGGCLVLGVGLLIVWGLARSRRGWLLTLLIISAGLTAASLILDVLIVRPVRVDPHRGLWTTATIGAAATLLWLLIMVACLIEWRLRPRESVARSGRPWWQTAVAVAIPLAVVTALVITIAVESPGWMVAVNSRVEPGAAAGTAQPSKLDGSVRWSTELVAAEARAEPTTAGLAVGVGADRDNNAGVVVLDPATGKVRWRYQLRGLATAPKPQAIDGGRAVLISPDTRDAPDEMSIPTFTLNADTGRIRAFWPNTHGAPESVDPPVLYDHVAQGTNSIIGLDPDGKKLWRYHPERCADPRGATATPSVTIVRGRRCAGDGVELIGLDSRTGKRLWTQPSQSNSESGPSQLIASRDYVIEQTKAGLQRRRLDTGAIVWNTGLTSGCGDQDFYRQADSTVFAAGCEQNQHEAISLTAFGLDDGRQAWRRTLPRPTVALQAVDADRVLAVTSSERTCRVELLTKDNSTTLQSFPADEYRKGYTEHYRQGSVRCAESSLLRVGDTYVVQLRVAPDPQNHSIDAPERFRFVALN